jgi:hypothetical protein
VAHRRLSFRAREKRGGKKLPFFFLFQKLRQETHAQFFFFDESLLVLLYSTAEKKRREKKKTFTRFFFPSQYKKKRDTPRARSHYFLAEEISKVSIVVREVAREIRGGFCACAFESRAIYIFF